MFQFGWEFRLRYLGGVSALFKQFKQQGSQ
jgi:hypothetical protein